MPGSLCRVLVCTGDRSDRRTGTVGLRGSATLSPFGILCRETRLPAGRLLAQSVTQPGRLHLAAAFTVCRSANDGVTDQSDARSTHASGVEGASFKLDRVSLAYDLEQFSLFLLSSGLQVPSPLVGGS